jgi:hypothetical protein
MKKSGLRGTVLASLLAIITLSANAGEGITGTPDQYGLHNSEHQTVMTQARHGDRNSQRATAPDTLDIVFVVSNALLGAQQLTQASQL